MSLAGLSMGPEFPLAVGIGSTVLGGLLGTIIGLMCGYWMGLFDLLIQRIIDMMQALPLLVMALVMAASLGPVP
jgi:peptide/nickel transport system permease protein